MQLFWNRRNSILAVALHCLGLFAFLIALPFASAQSMRDGGSDVPLLAGDPTLETVTVDSQRIGYAVPESSVATKTDTPLLETPASIQVVPRQVIEDQAARTLDEVLINVAGARGSSAGWSEDIYLRGFVTSTYFRDGFRIDDPSGLGGLASLANVDSVEVLKGPGAILYGRVEPGGVVNITTRQPQETAAQSVELGLGSWNHAIASVDATGPVDEGKSLLYRAIASVETTRSWVDNVKDQRLFLAPSVQWRVDDLTQVALEGTYARYRSVLYQQAVVPYDTTTNRFQWGPKSANPAPYYFNPDTSFVGLTWSHRLGEDWVLRQRLSHERVEFSTPLNLSSSFGPLALVNNVWTLSLGSAQLAGDTESDGTIVDLTGHFQTGPAHHTLLAGGDFYRLGAYYTSRYSNPSGPFVDVPLYSSNAPSPSGIPLDPDTYYVTESVTKSHGIYLQDQMKLPGRIDLLAGLRYQDVRSSGYSNNGLNFGGTGIPVENSPAHDTALTPRAGLLWQPQDQWSLYTSWSQNFGATNAGAGADWQGHPLKPEGATQAEAGAKAELPGSKANLSLAVFNLVKTNVAANDLAHPNGTGGFFPTTIGQIASRGVELTLQGEFAPGWEALAAYTHDHAFVKIGTATYAQGSDMPFVPRDMLRLYSTWKFRAAPLVGLKMGAGLTWEGPAPGVYVDPNTYATETSVIRAPSYVIFDAMASYEFRAGVQKVTLQANVKNLANRTYYTDAFLYVAPWGYVTWGAPRSFLTSAKVEF